MESLVLARDIAVRRLQDVAGEYALLPRRVRLSQITERRYVGGGGEASIWLAKLEGEPVVSRECPHPEDGDWEGEDGRRILKVIFCNQSNAEPFKTPSTERDLCS